LISRDGWATFDDATRNQYGWDNEDWWQSPNTDDIDLYFFGHGYEYKQALTDYQAIGGKTAMVPRYAHGIWYRCLFCFVLFVCVSHDECCIMS
jgi:alpha-glucosidase (family GH31 glycosyl hydrolase)